ncbi:PREDICTED: LOC110767396 isoform X2, partial [Prunus dulcis]
PSGAMTTYRTAAGLLLPPTTARLAGLITKEKAIPLSQKRNLPFISKSGDIVGEFSKVKPKSGRQSPHSSGKVAAPTSSEGKQVKKQSAGKKQAAGKPRKFIPKVALSGPPRTREATPPEHSRPARPIASESRSRTDRVLETPPLCSECHFLP